MNIKILKSNSREAIRELTTYTCKLLNIDPYYIEIDDLAGENTNGMCIDISDDSFLILLKDHDQMLRTLVHELVHVKQYMKQDLGSHLDSKSEKYGNSWWEVEARELAENIMESYNERNDTCKQ